MAFQIKCLFSFDKAHINLNCTFPFLNFLANTLSNYVISVNFAIHDSSQNSQTVRRNLRNEEPAPPHYVQCRGGNTPICCVGCNRVALTKSLGGVGQLSSTSYIGNHRFIELLKRDNKKFKCKCKQTLCWIILTNDNNNNNEFDYCINWALRKLHHAWKWHNIKNICLNI